MVPGIAVIDNSCYRALAEGNALARFRGNLAVADLEARPSEVNLLEAAVTRPPSVRDRLLATIKDLAGTAGLLPWPFLILQRVGRAIANNERGFYLGASGKEWYLDDKSAIEEIRDQAKAFSERLEERFSFLHNNARRKLQRHIKASGQRYTVDSARNFLDEEWNKGETMTVFAQATWKALGLPAEAPVSTLRMNDGWRLLLDAEGLAIFQRALVHEQPKRVQRADLIQLVYMGHASRRMLVTADNAFLEAANTILRGRYSNARAVHIDGLVK